MFQLHYGSWTRSPGPKQAIEESKNPTEMIPEVSQKDSPETEADVVSDSETDSWKYPNKCLFAYVLSLL